MIQRGDYLLNRIVILSAREPDVSLLAYANALADRFSVHVLAFNPARGKPAHEYDGRVYLQRLRGTSALMIGFISAYLLLSRRMGNLLPPPNSVHGVGGWIWHWLIARTLYKRCQWLSLRPLAFVAVDSVALGSAKRLSARYRCAAVPVEHLDEIVKLLSTGAAQ
jgi:hypothetical protein